MAITLGQTLSFTATATDPEVPPQTPHYSLNGVVPAGASITSGGVFTFTPSEAGSFDFTVQVADTGTPVGVDTEAFAVLVVLGAVRGVNLHPMHYFFLGASFFAFHLLFAYLVDHILLDLAFVIAAGLGAWLFLDSGATVEVQPGGARPGRPWGSVLFGPGFVAGTF